MEEILASIRRIIADEDAAPAEPPADTRRPPPMQAAPPPIPPAADPSATTPDDIDAMFASFGAEVEEPNQGAALQEPEHRLEPTEAVRETAPGRLLLSDHAAAAVSSAFGTLAHTVVMQNARTLDDLVRDMLRPMLKAWLDENLPALVERLVSAEIERVSRRPG